MKSRRTLNPKDKTLIIALTSEEHQYIKTQAVQRQMTMAVFVINAIKEYVSHN
jgi:hypothetical protein